MNKVSLKPLLLVLSTVVLGLMSAWGLQEAAQQQHISVGVLMLVLVIVTAVNGARFFIWGYIHRCYPISMTYPLNSIFFPMIFLMGYYYGEMVSLQKALGVIMITIGVAMMTYRYTPD